MPKVGRTSPYAREDGGRRPGRPTKQQSIDDKDIDVKNWVLRNIRSFIQEKIETCQGNPSKILQQASDALCCAVLHAGPPPPRKVEAFRRVTGFTRNMIERADILREIKSVSPQQLRSTQSFTFNRGWQTSGPKQKKSMHQQWVYDWFHDMEKNTMIFVDKRRPEHLKGRYSKIKLDGKVREVTCVRHFMNGHKQDLVQLFLNSPEYKAWQEAFPGLTLSRSAVQACICPCMRPAQVTECACRICTEMESAIRAWHVQRRKWHKAEKCECSGCSNPKQNSEYMRASKDLRTFRDVCLCAKVPFPDLALPHLPDTIPHFRQISCCKYSEAGKYSEAHPAHTEECQNCGVQRRLYHHPDCIEQDPHKEASWMQWQTTEVDASEKSGGKALRMVFREKKGTRKLLLDRIFKLARVYFYHHWVHSVTAHMGRLRNATYEPACHKPVFL